MWVNVNFERRDLTSARKSHPSPDDFRETFELNLIKENVTHFFHLFNTNFFVVALENLQYCQVL